MTTTTRPRRARSLVRVPLTILAGYLVVRGLAEPWVIDTGDPATYRNDWGGPSLIGVLVVHSGSAVLIPGYALIRLRRRLNSAGTSS